MLTTTKQGTFIWVDLALTNTDKAKAFYGALFGWTYVDRPEGPGKYYSLCGVGSAAAAALYMVDPELQGNPPIWTSYIKVDDVDATTQKAVQNGGKVIVKPFNMADGGRMAIVADPTGATVSLYQTGTFPGAGVWSAPGAVMWNDLYTPDPDAAGKFYTQTFDWDATPVDIGPMGTYTLFSRHGEGFAGNVGGMTNVPWPLQGGTQATRPDIPNYPPAWLVWFGVEDCDASTKKALDLGAKIIAPCTDIPNFGRFSIVEGLSREAVGLFKDTTK